LTGIPHVSFRTHEHNLLQDETVPKHRYSVEMRTIVIGPKPDGAVPE